MAEAAKHENIGVVMDGPSGQRFVERLIRSGLAAHIVPHDALAREALPGQFYLSTLDIASQTDVLAQRGAHTCLIPPWSGEMAAIGSANIGVEVVERRGAVRFAASIVDVGRGDVLTPFKILYRERLIGTLGMTLVESEYGEPLLATLPRASNLQGYILVSTLQLSITSAQTRFEDVARLLKQVFVWCAAHAEPVASLSHIRSEETVHDDLGERFAPIVTLALALALLQEAALSPHREATPGSDVADRRSVRYIFDRVCQILGLSIESPGFDAGWAWLETRAVVSPLEDDLAQIQKVALEHYCAIWQLSPRLRRLRQAAVNLRTNEGEIQAQIDERGAPNGR